MNVALVRAASQASSMGGLGSTTALPTAGKSAAPDPVVSKVAMYLEWQRDV